MPRRRLKEEEPIFRWKEEWMDDEHSDYSIDEDEEEDDYQNELGLLISL